MKQVIILLLIFCASFAVQAQDSTSVTKIITTTTKAVYSDAKAATSTVYQDGKEVIKNMTPKIEAALSALAVSLKTTSEKVWAVLIAKRQVDGLIDLFYCSLFLIVTFILYKWFSPVYRAGVANDQKSEYWDNHVLEIIIVVIGFIFLLILGLYCLFSIGSMFRNLFLPEYGAMQDVVEMISKIL